MSIIEIQNPEKIALKRAGKYGDDKSDVQQLPLITEEIQIRQKRIKDDILHIGRLLVEGKRLQKHGDFLDWIKANFEFSIAHATNMMRVYTECAQHPEVVESIIPSVLYRVVTKSFPEKFRKFLLENADNLKEINNKEIKELADHFSENEFDPESEEAKALIEYNETITEYGEYRHELEDCFDVIRKALNQLEKLPDKIKWPILPDYGKITFTRKDQRELKRLIIEIKKAAIRIMPWEKAVKVVKELKPDNK